MDERILDPKQFQLFLSENEIQSMIQSLSEQLNSDYQGKTVVLVCVLKGGVFFLADLIRQLKFPIEVEFVKLHRTGKGKSTSGTVTLIKDIELNLENKNIIIVEEIIDSGRTLKFLVERLKHSQAHSVEILTLLDKREKRVTDIKAKYVGRIVEDPFLVGYGLDLEERCRNLRQIYKLRYPN